jgi:THO complex subunit 2
MESIPLKRHSQGSLADPEAKTARGEPSFAEGNSRINDAKDDGFVAKRPQICLLGLLSYSPEKGFVEELRPGLVSSSALLLLSLLSVFQARSETGASRSSLGGSMAEAEAGSEAIAAAVGPFSSEGRQLAEALVSGSSLPSLAPDVLAHELTGARARGIIGPSAFADALSHANTAGLAPDYACATWAALSAFHGANRNSSDSSGSSGLHSALSACFDRIGEGLLALATSGALSTDSIVARIPNDMLRASRLVDFERAKKDAIKLNTAAFFEQPKFNLLKEEPEGFAKLLSLLSEQSASASDIQSLLGAFDLEPIRACDLCLDAAELHLLCPSTILQLFGSEKPQRLLGHKLKSFADNQSPLRQSLASLVARFVKDGSADLGMLLAFMSPTHDSLKSQAAKRKTTKMARANAIKQVSLSDAGASGEEKSRREEEELRQEREELDAEEREHLLNQRLVLAIALVEERDWNTARKLIRDVASANVDVVSHAPIRRALCDYLRELAWPIFQKHLKPSEERLWPSPEEERSAAEHIPADFFDVLFTLGSGLSEDTKLFCVCARVYRCHLVAILGAKRERATQSAHEPEHVTEARNHAQLAIGRVFMSALMLLKPSAAMCAEVHNISLLLEYHERWRLYYLHRNELDKDPRPALRAAMASAEKDTQFSLRRISRENTRDLGRKLCIPALTAPAAMLRIVLNFIESYDNLIYPVTEALRSLTPLALDVLLFTLADMFVTSGREKVKEDGTSSSDWLANLSKFTGMVSRRFVWMEQKGCEGFDVGAIIDLCIKQLRAGSSADLLVLKELLSCMAGEDIVEDVSNTQLDALCGGPNLRTYYIGKSHHGLTQRQIGKGVNALKPALGLRARTLLAEIGKSVSEIPFAQNELDVDLWPLKLVSHLVDSCQEVFMQLCSFLERAYGDDIETFASIVPVPPKLVIEGVPHALALRAYRPVLRAASLPDGSLTHEERRKSVCVLGRTFGDLADSIRNVLPGNAQEFASDDFLVLFWSCTAYDLAVPRDLYKTARSKVDGMMEQMPVRPNPRDDAETQHQHKKEREHLGDLAEQLPKEMKEQEKRVQEVDERLRYSSNNWLHAHQPPHSHYHIDLLLESLLLPRAKLSSLDAIFVAKMIDLLHERSPPSFSFVVLSDHLLQSVGSLVFGTTAREAERMGVVVRFILAKLTALRTAQRHETRSPAMCTDLSDQLDSCMTPKELIRSCYRWDGLIGEALASSMKSSEWMEAKNALLLATKLSDTFPLLESTRAKLVGVADSIVNEDSRSDLRTIAQSTSTALQRFKGKWQVPENFLGRELLEQVQRAEQEEQQCQIVDGASDNGSALAEHQQSMEDDGMQKDLMEQAKEKQSEQKRANTAEHMETDDGVGVRNRLNPKATEFAAERKAASATFHQHLGGSASDALNGAQADVPPPPPVSERPGMTGTTATVKQQSEKAAIQTASPTKPPAPPSPENRAERFQQEAEVEKEKENEDDGERSGSRRRLKSERERDDKDKKEKEDKEKEKERESTSKREREHSRRSRGGSSRGRHGKSERDAPEEESPPSRARKSHHNGDKRKRSPTGEDQRQKKQRRR